MVHSYSRTTQNHRASHFKVRRGALVYLLPCWLSSNNPSKATATRASITSSDGELATLLEALPKLPGTLGTLELSSVPPPPLLLSVVGFYHLEPCRARPSPLPQDTKHECWSPPSWPRTSSSAIRSPHNKNRLLRLTACPSTYQIHYLCFFAFNPHNHAMRVPCPFYRWEN